MKLINSTLRPGRVIGVSDDGSGNIKVEAPGLFSRDDIENLPSIMPFFHEHCNSFSSVNEGDEVWVLSQSDNPQDLRWLRKDDFKEANEEFLKEPECEIIVNRESSYGGVLIYYTETSGLVLKCHNSTIQIRQDGSILLDSNEPHRVIDINSNGISIGSSGSSEHPGAYGDELETLANLIYSTFSVIAQAASGNQFTAPISAAINPMLPRIQQQIPNITSNNVTLD